MPSTPSSLAIASSRPGSAGTRKRTSGPVLPSIRAPRVASERSRACRSVPGGIRSTAKAKGRPDFAACSRIASCAGPASNQPGLGNSRPWTRSSAGRVPWDRGTRREYSRPATEPGLGLARRAQPAARICPASRNPSAARHPGGRRLAGRFLDARSTFPERAFEQTLDGRLLRIGCAELPDRLARPIGVSPYHRSNSERHRNRQRDERCSHCMFSSGFMALARSKMWIASEYSRDLKFVAR